MLETSKDDTAEGAEEEYDYEGERQKLKLGSLATCVLLFKTTVGVGIFAFQSAYSKCGFLLASTITLAILYMVVYGMQRLLDLVSLIEADETVKKLAYLNSLDKSGLNAEADGDGIGIDTQVDRFEVVTYHQIPNQIKTSMRKFYVFISIICVAGTGFGVALANFVFLLNTCTTLLGNEYYYAILAGIFILVAAELALIVEPEKIKPVAMVLSVLVFSVACTYTGYNLYRYGAVLDATQRNKLDYIYESWPDAGRLVGVALYSFESISTVLTVRRTAQHPARMRTYVSGVFFTAGIFFVIFAASFHLLFGKNTIKPLAFDYYQDLNILKYFKYAVVLNPFFSIPFYLISTVELFEQVRPIAWTVRNKFLVLSPKRILRTRLFLLFVIALMACFLKSLAKILDLVGSLFGPSLGILLPVADPYHR